MQCRSFGRLARTVLLLGCLTLVPGLAGAEETAANRLENWHHWRGPLATGFAPKGEPPLRWDEKTNLKWKAPLPGRGSSTPIVWGDRVFVLTAIDTGRMANPEDLPKQDPRYEKKTPPPQTYHQFVVMCLDRNTGRVLWKQVAAEKVPHEGHHTTHSYAAGSPMTDGEALYVSFGSHGLACYDLDGKLRWQRDLGRQETRYGWGEASTPVVHGQTVIVNWDHEGQSFLVALEARTGKQLWKVDRDEPSSWATPLIVEHDGRTQVITNGTNKIRSYDLTTGKVIWQCGGMTLNAIPSPVVKDGKVYCLSGYRGSSALAIPLDAKGDVTDTDKVIWRLTRGTPYVPSPLLVGDRLYFTQRNDPLLSCVDITTGKVLIDRARLPEVSTLYASPVCAGDRIYFTDREGTTVVIRRADEVELLAINKLDDTTDASPAIVGKQIFLRGHKALYCIEAP